MTGQGDCHHDQRCRGDFAPDQAGQTSRQAFRRRLAVVTAVALFGIVCLAAGMYIVDWFSRFEIRARERSYGDILAGRAASRPETPSSPPASVVAQPNNIYFMVGTPGMAYPPPYAGAPGFYQPLPALQPSAAPDMNQFLMQKYQQEYMDYLRQRAPLPAPGAQPGQPFHYLANPGQGMPFPGGYGYPGYPLNIVVPENLSVSLKKRFSRNSDVENWLREETAQNGSGPADTTPGLSPTGPLGAEMEDILRRLAESTFEDGQYERTARIYAELADRKINLGVQEMLRWAKAAELSGDKESSLRILDLVMRNDPNNVNVLREIADLLTGSQRFAEAADVYQKLMALNPGERLWRINRAKTLTWAGKGKEAVGLLQKLYEEDPNDEELTVMLSELLLSEHMFEEALPIIDHLIKAHPGELKYMTSKLNALMALQRFKDAAALCAQMLEIRPGDEELLLKMAVSLVAAQEFAAAVDPFEKYLTLKPEDAKVREQFGDCLMAAGRFKDAAAQFKIVSDAADPENLDVMAKQANALMAAQEFPEASYVYSILVEKRPDDKEVAMGFVVSLRMSGHIDQALVAASEFLSRHPEDRPMLIQGAEIAVERGNFTLATKWYRTAVKLDSRDYKTRVALGSTLLWAREYGEAESEFRKALVIKPEYFEARRGLARALFHQRRYDESNTVYNQLMAEDGRDGVIEAEFRYRCALMNGMDTEAASQLARLKELEPEDITWRGDRAQALLRRHRFDEAMEQAEDVYAHDPEHRPTLESMQNLNRHLTTLPVQARAGMLKKDSDETADADNNRRARITQYWGGLHGEKSLTTNFRLAADADYELYKLRTAGVKDPKATALRGRLLYEGQPNWSGYAELGYRWFRGNDLDDEWLYNARIDVREVGGMPLDLGFFSTRREHYDNWFNVRDGLYANDWGVDGHYRYRKWDFNAMAKTSIFTDNNYNIDLTAAAKYRLIDEPMFELGIGPNAEYLTYKYEKPTYWSPKDYQKIGIGLVGRSYLCRDPEVWGGPVSYVDFGYSLSFDRFSSIGHKVFVGFNRDFSPRFTMFARADYNKETYYDEFKLFGGLEYKFGGCE